MQISVADQWWHPFLGVGCAEVFYVDLSAHAMRETLASAWLCEQETGRAARFLYAGPRRRYILLRGALRSMLCDRLNCQNSDLAFESAEHGKPFAIVKGASARLQFNMSDSGRHGLIAIAPFGQIGIDVEERSTARDLEGLSETVFGPDEQACIASVHGQEKVERFYRLWTMKEALVKALGTGLYLDVSGFQVPPELLRGESSALFRFPHLADIRWRVEDLSTEDFAAAIAHEMDPLNSAEVQEAVGDPLPSARISS
jgi:4'-phosphopantetheinyl transferase